MSFNFDEFMSSTKPRVAKVAVYGVDHSVRLEELADLIDEAAVDAEVGSGDNRLGGKSALSKLSAEDAGLRQEMDDSRVELHFRPLTPGEMRKIQALPEDLQEEAVLEQLAIQSIEGLTVDQWRQLGDRLGVAQWSEIVGTATSVSLSAVHIPKASPNISAPRRAPKRSAS